MKLTITTTLTVADDMTVATFGVAVAGLPKDIEDGPHERLADKVADAFAVVIKQHNEQVFNSTRPVVTNGNNPNRRS